MKKIELIKQKLEFGETDLQKIAEETEASLNTVKTQWYKWKKTKPE